MEKAGRTAGRILPTLLTVCLCCSARGPSVPQAAPPSASPANDISRAKALIEQGKPDEAIALLNQAAQAGLQTPGLEAALGKAYYAKRDYVQAAKHLEAALQQKPDDGESTQLLGLSYYQLGHARQAIPLLEKVQSWLPEPEVNGTFLLGISYIQTYQYEKARNAFARVFGTPPNSAQAHLVLGQMLIRQNFEDQAMKELQSALALDPRLPMAHFLIGEIELYRSHIAQAIDEFRKELELDPVLWMPYWRLGDAYARLERWNDAERALKQAIWLNRDFSGSFILMGKVQLKKGDAALAAEFLQQALKMDPNNASAHYLLGTAYRELGRTQSAEREFELSRRSRSQEEP
jgi:tetratricopeptide (TPR) repeat protein